MIELASTYTDSNRVSDSNLPRPPADRPYWIFRVSTEDDWKISPRSSSNRCRNPARPADSPGPAENGEDPL